MEEYFGLSSPLTPSSLSLSSRSPLLAVLLLFCFLSAYTIGGLVFERAVVVEACLVCSHSLAIFACSNKLMEGCCRRVQGSKGGSVEEQTRVLLYWRHCVGLCSYSHFMHRIDLAFLLCNLIHQATKSVGFAFSNPKHAHNIM